MLLRVRAVHNPSVDPAHQQPCKNYQQRSGGTHEQTRIQRREVMIQRPCNITYQTDRAPHKLD
jgi:hypothetical protein